MTRESVLESVKGLPLEQQQREVLNLYRRYEDEENYANTAICAGVLMQHLDMPQFCEELPRLYNLAEQYDDTIFFVENWMADSSLENFFRENLKIPYNLALAYMATGNKEKSIKYFKLTASYAQYNIDNYRQDDENSEEFYEFMLATCLAYAGKAYYELNDVKNATQCLGDSNAIYPTPVGLFQVGLIFYRSGDPKYLESAITNFEDIADLSQKRRPGIYGYACDCIAYSNYYLGLIYAREKGDRDTALMRLRRAKELGCEITDSEIDSIISEIKPKKSSFLKKLFR